MLRLTIISVFHTPSAGSQGDFLEAVHFGRPVSTDGAVRHMGDEVRLILN